MRSAQLLSAAALAGLAAASPAPQQMDMAAIFEAPPATVTGPPIAAISQVVDLDTASLQASISDAVTEIATAKITGAAASNAANMAPPTSVPSKRDLGEHSLQKRGVIDSLLSYWGAQLASAYSTKTTAAATSTAAPAVAGKVVATSTSTSKSASTSAYFTSMPLTSTTSVTTIPGTSSTTSSTTACPTTPEDGTYCGFINPEDPCAPQPDGYAPATTPDTTDAFLANPVYHQMAQKASTPNGYVNTFTDLNASSSANSYLGLHTLTSYSPSDCAAWCDNTTLCTAFNIYIERDPSQNPCQNDSTDPTVWGYWCPQPSSISNYKCTLWGSNLDSTTATNQGGWRGQFNVIVTGSNGYDKTNLTVPDLSGDSTDVWDTPQNCSGKAVDGGAYWLGSQVFKGPFDPNLCATYASAVTAYNKQVAIQNKKKSYTPCQMFNSYHVVKNGIPVGTYCSLYTAQLSTKWATYSGGYSGRDFYGVRNSWSCQRKVPDSGKC